MPRRSIADSLSASEIKFLKAPLVEESNNEALAQKSIEKKLSEKSTPKPDLPKRIKPVSQKRRPSSSPPLSSETNFHQQPWVTITTRLPNRLHARLRRVAFERGERGEQPSKIQDILAQAALRWLEENEPDANLSDQPANSDG